MMSENIFCIKNDHCETVCGFISTYISYTAQTQLWQVGSVSLSLMSLHIMELTHTLYAPQQHNAFRSVPSVRPYKVMSSQRPFQ